MESGIAYCYGCNHYFPLTAKSKGSRGEIEIPWGTDFLRLRIQRDELEIKIKWRYNFKFWKVLFSDTGGWPGPFIIIAALINQTIIEVRAGYIKIDHSPIDLLPAAFYSSNMIQQLQVKPIQNQKWYGATSSDYGLYALLSTGKDQLLIWDLKRTTLLFIEQEMERVLKIADQV